MRCYKSLILVVAVMICVFPQSLLAESFKIGIMQDKPGAAQKYAPMLAFFKSKGIDVKLQGYPIMLMRL